MKSFSFLAYGRFVAFILMSHCLTGLAFLPRTPSWFQSEYRQCSMVSGDESRGTDAYRMNESPANAHNWNHRAFKIIASTATAFLVGNIAETYQIQLPVSPYGVFLPPQAMARNLPQSNGASSANRGTAASLVPILKLKETVDSAILKLPSIVEIDTLFKDIPSVEKDFKKLFDEHSEGVSYKQQFLDQNAFLVYYTKGFDGPGRPSIEEEDSSSIKEKGQFGARNDAWVAVDDARGEISYLLEYKKEKVNTKDLKKALVTASKALDSYFSYDSIDTVTEAQKLL